MNSERSQNGRFIHSQASESMARYGRLQPLRGQIVTVLGCPSICLKVYTSFFCSLSSFKGPDSLLGNYGKGKNAVFKIACIRRNVLDNYREKVLF